ncbi:uncharacterized protein N7515_006016 [Penicillium bovifimosum]|uniref:Uncharacterized protein n=1 Tax=Penicillium bovifimosum TaxID=126998 RepID=A0A9W9L0S9_9EURO|nr:uncharacterized protein N7515_006016 [Penicillium bovifimosum]KAJ5129977.1 hypothetical protein N7515_006016 [Penicillium bovifimosum]
MGGLSLPTGSGKVAKDGVSKKPPKKTGSSKESPTLRRRRSMLIGHGIDVKAAGLRLYRMAADAPEPPR